MARSADPIPDDPGAVRASSRPYYAPMTSPTSVVVGVVLVAGGTRAAWIGAQALITGRLGRVVRLVSGKGGLRDPLAGALAVTVSGIALVQFGAGQLVSSLALSASSAILLFAGLGLGIARDRHVRRAGERKAPVET